MSEKVKKHGRLEQVGQATKQAPTTKRHVINHLTRSNGKMQYLNFVLDVFQDEFGMAYAEILALIFEEGLQVLVAEAVSNGVEPLEVRQ